MVENNETFTPRTILAATRNLGFVVACQSIGLEVKGINTHYKNDGETSPGPRHRQRIAESAGGGEAAAQGPRGLDPAGRRVLLRGSVGGESLTAIGLDL